MILFPLLGCMTYLVLHDLLGSSKTYDNSILTTTSTNTPSSTNVSSLLQFTIPDGKLFYPEPFIASPSYLHSDITYLHIFQYWYWLWFLFIFLICFFFISFVSTVRWCTNRVRPRRETRGVSRSKCGDLITACVPVTWAVSIIVNESTDAMDLNDGFGTAELVVGVRAYQWGWEYYYPRSIDLNYNVRPSYSSFVGNSLKYNFSSAKNISSNMLWRMYQNKTEDRVVTPAHLMLIPTDSSSSLNFLNFQNIGLNTLQESSAFSKIRNSTKVYNSHLVHTPSTFSDKYNLLTALYTDDNSSLMSSSFGVRKQHNLLSTTSLGNSLAGSLLDSNSFSSYLEHNLNLNRSIDLASYSNSLSAPSALSLVKPEDLSNRAEVLRLSALVEDERSSSNSQLALLAAHSTWESNFNDNSDKAGVSYPATKVASPTLIDAKLTSTDSSYSQSRPLEASSTTENVTLSRLSNSSSNPRVFNLSGPNSKVLAGEQSIRFFNGIHPYGAHLNLSEGVNALKSNEEMKALRNINETPLDSTYEFKNCYIDKPLLSKVSSSRSFNNAGLPPILSADTAHSNSLEYDSGKAVASTLKVNQQGEISRVTTSKRSPVGEVFVGSREKTPRSINTAYWSTFWANSNHSHRVNGALAASLNQSHFYLPTFSLYSDYDFRNDQAIEMLDELFWENSYSAYNFYDYMNLNSNFSKDFEISKKDLALSGQFFTSNVGSDYEKLPLSAKPSKDLSLVGAFYSNSVQMENSILSPRSQSTESLGFLPVLNELSELDDSYATFKNLSQLFSRFSSPTLGASASSLSVRSYLSVFNYFRSDFEDFVWSSTSSEPSNPSMDSEYLDLSSYGLANDSASDLFNEATSLGNDLRLSNPVTLRSSVRNSIVNYNAFQKVFKPRLDEGRAHVQSSSFSDLKLAQPFINDSKVPYTQLLGKNRDNFYSTPLYKVSSKLNLNIASSLADSLNTPMYDFPFLLARTSDTMRFTWVDWFSSWKYIEVQPSSVSRYSTLGVPYLRRPFDFNSGTGDKFQDTELYFTRVARSRRNYLTNWSYSPFMYNRAYVWNSYSAIDANFLSPHTTAASAKNACGQMSWYWNALAFVDNTSNSVTFSSSGNDVYGKSTWRPQSSIASYYYQVSKLVDILSRREFLYRRFLENAYAQPALPRSLSATPNNPLLKEVKASFLFTDPATYSSEYSRDLLYSSAPYFKFIYLQNLVNTVSATTDFLPLNTSLLTNYLFFYFFGSNDSSLGRNSELAKSQFRPLKKGISSMLRLHATGAVAMPIEIRLQVLASSRDVIHSWAIPSASIKIDCVPGYTSHRMMKFLLTGVYWGQCQEICGRYHHWMPIVVYFMKRDLFFLWCTHFVFNPASNSTWDISDRRFADLIRFASYDKSSWLTEFGVSE